MVFSVQQPDQTSMEYVLGVQRPAPPRLPMFFPYLTVKVLLSDKLGSRKTRMAAHHYEGLPMVCSPSIFSTI